VRSVEEEEEERRGERVFFVEKEAKNAV